MGIADNTPQKGYCLYAHICQANDKVYIGISKDVKKRWAGKIHAYKNSTLFQNALKKYGWDGFIHIVICDSLTLEEACEKEKQWIEAYKKEGMSYNLTDGGEGHLGILLTEEQKQKLRDIRLGSHPTKETRKKQSEAQKNSNHRRKEIFAFDSKSGELVHKYSSVIEAAQDLHLRDSCISQAARGIYKTSGGYIWSYKPTIDKKSLSPKKIVRNRRLKIYCYDLYGNFIKEYDCAYEAVAEVGGSYKAIHSCCHKDKISYMGYIWRYNLCEIEEEILKRVKHNKYETY